MITNRIQKTYQKWYINFVKKSDANLGYQYMCMHAATLV